MDWLRILQFVVFAASIVSGYLIWEKESTEAKSTTEELPGRNSNRAWKKRKREKQKQRRNDKHPRFRQYLLLTSIIIGPSALYQITVIENGAKDDEQKKSSPVGVITPNDTSSGNNADNETITVLFGGNVMSTDMESLRRGEYSPLSVAGAEPFRLRLENEKILISTKFISLDGKIAATMVDNEWQINPNNNFDRNYDDHGLEVIDDHGIKFQIDFDKRERVLSFNGICRYGESVAFFNQEVLQMFNEGRWKLKEMQELNQRIPALFRFPSRLHINERVKSEEN